MNDLVSIGLVGCGYWGKNLYRVLNDLGTLHSICDRDPATLKRISEGNKGLNLVTDIEDILADETIDALVIASPAAMHYELAKEALLRDKDVFVEKPLALKVEEGEELVKMAKEKEKVLMVGHIIQYHPAILKLKEMINNGELGKLQYIYSNRVNMGKLRTEENILWSFAPHDISVILMLLEEEPTKVSAFGGAYLNEGIYDTTLTELSFSNGVKGHIFVSWLHPYKEQKLIVVGNGAMVVFDDVSKEKLFIYRHGISWRQGKIPIANKSDYEIIQFQMEEPLMLEMNHFLDCVRNRTTPRTDGDEGLRVLKILQLAENGLREESNKTA